MAFYHMILCKTESNRDSFLDLGFGIKNENSYFYMAISTTRAQAQADADGPPRGVPFPLRHDPATARRRGWRRPIAWGLVPWPL